MWPACSKSIWTVFTWCTRPAVSAPHTHAHGTPQSVPRRVDSSSDGAAIHAKVAQRALHAARALGTAYLPAMPDHVHVHGVGVLLSMLDWCHGNLLPGWEALTQPGEGTMRVDIGGVLREDGGDQAAERIAALTGLRVAVGAEQVLAHGVDVLQAVAQERTQVRRD